MKRQVRGAQAPPPVRSAFGDLQEGFAAGTFALRLLGGRGAVLGLFGGLFGPLEAALEIGGVELVYGLDLGDQYADIVGEHLEPALALSVGFDIGVGLVQP